MATVIDELIVVLNLDPKKFTEAQKAALQAFKRTQEQATSTAKSIEAQGKKILDVFSDLKREAITLMAVFLGGRGLKDAVMHITHLDASAERLSRRVNASAHDINIWRSVIIQAGGAAEDADAAINGMAEAIANQNQSGVLNQGLLNIWARLPLAPQDRQDPNKVLQAMAEYSQNPQFKGPQGGANFAAFANQFPGVTPGLINALIQGPKKLQEFLSNAEKAGVGNDESGRAAEKFNQSLALLEQTSLNVVRAMEIFLIPTIERLATLFGLWTNPNSPEAKKVHEEAKNKTLKGAAQAFADWVDYGMWGLPVPGGAGKPVITTPKPKRDTGIGSLFGGATGFSVEESGLVIASGSIGAKGATASSIVHNRTSHQTNTNSNSISVDTINMHLPQARDAGGIMTGLKGISGAYYNQSFGASANSGSQ